jgi:hypothetical protein
MHSFIFFFTLNCFASSVKLAEFGGQFYPSSKEELAQMIDKFLDKAEIASTGSGPPLILIAPHAGYGFSGQTAAFGYKLIKDKKYKTVVILGTSHHKSFNGAVLYGGGAFATSLGQVNVDEDFIKKLSTQEQEVFVDTAAFNKEHSVEVQLPFLQKVLTDFKIVPVVVGDCSLETCQKLALLLKEAIGQRKDILIVVSTDLYHGYDLKEADRIDETTLSFLKKMDYQGLYYALREGSAQACGGFAMVIALSLAKSYGLSGLKVLNHTNSGLVTADLVDGHWTVGYASCAVFGQEGEVMLNLQQKAKLLKIARQAIMTYLQTGKKPMVLEFDPVLNQKSGAFVTLNQRQELRGCIGNLTGSGPLYLTVADMAIEAAVGDVRFNALSLAELKDVEIEISVLSALQKVDSAESIELGKHGVLVRKGYQSGVFLPQVATETGWSKGEFLDNLCVHKAGLPANAWRGKGTELYIFTADVFSEKEVKE